AKHDWEKQHEPVQAERDHRWAQIRIELESAKPQQTPRLSGKLTLTVHSEKGKAKEKARASAARLKSVAPPPPVTSVPFVYEGPSPRLKFLREKYKLDQVIAPGKTEMEQLMLLRYWVRNQWHTAWQSHPAGWMPPWDSLIILRCKDDPDCLTMCTHYACVFTQ